MKMYRKYSGSTKCSRNERLAQLSEQENVIERKKKEILAKIEAKKKKETEEALRKLEPTSTYKNDPPESKNNSCHRERDAEDEEIKPQTPRNAFSNDGSFLDQFKKLSRSGLGSTSISTSGKITQKEEEDSSIIKQEYAEREENKKLIDSNQSRWDTDDHMKGKKSCDGHLYGRNPQDFNIQRQLLQPGVDHSVSERISGASSKVKPGENSNKDYSSLSVSAPGSLIKLTSFERKWQNQEPDERPDKGGHLGECEYKSMGKRLWDSSKTQFQCLNSISSSNNNSCGADDSTRSKYEPVLIKRATPDVNVSGKILSPAFTHEVDNSVTSDNYHSSKTVGQREETSGLSTMVLANEAKKFLSEENTDCSTAFNYLNPEKIQGVSHLPKTIENVGIKDYDADRKGKRRNSEYDSSDSDSNSKDSFRSSRKMSYNINQQLKDKSGDGYQADCEDGSSFSKVTEQRQKKFLPRNTATDNLPKSKEVQDEFKDNENVETGDVLTPGETRKRRKKSRWGEEVVPAAIPNTATNTGPSQRPLIIPPVLCASTGKTPLLSKLTRSDPGLIQYAKQTFGSTNLSEEDWKKAEDHYKINLLYQDMVKKRAEIERLEKAGKFKYEYDSDEDVEGGTWEHKLRQQEMLATQLWAEELTRQAAGKHHIGDFLPPEELERFMERYNAVKQGRKPDLSDYKEFKLKEDNVGYRLLQKMGWNEGQGLGQDGSGITNPINKASTRTENQGLGVERPDGLEAGDDEYDAYRKRMMLAYRFRPNPLNNPRRPYY